MIRDPKGQPQRTIRLEELDGGPEEDKEIRRQMFNGISQQVT
jgi:hypothetical protein